MTAAVMSSPAVTMHTTVTAATTAVLLWPAALPAARLQEQQAHINNAGSQMVLGEEVGSKAKA